MKTPHDRTVVQCTVFPSSSKSCFKSNKLSLNLKMSRFLIQAHPTWQRDIVQWRRCWSLRSCMYSIPIPVGNWLCFDPISMYSRGVRGYSIWSVGTFSWRKKTAVLLDFVQNLDSVQIFCHIFKGCIFRKESIPLNNLIIWTFNCFFRLYIA